MMRRKLLHRIEGCVWSYQSYDDGGGGGASRMMKVCGATESALSNSIRISLW